MDIHTRTRTCAAARHPSRACTGKTTNGRTHGDPALVRLRLELVFAEGHQHLAEVVGAQVALHVDVQLVDEIVDGVAHFESAKPRRAWSQPARERVEQVSILVEQVLLELEALQAFEEVFMLHQLHHRRLVRLDGLVVGVGGVDHGIDDRLQPEQHTNKHGGRARARYISRELTAAGPAHGTNKQRRVLACSHAPQ